MSNNPRDPDYLAQLRERISLVDLIGRRVRLTKRGKEYSGRCPFHAEATPSFTVNPEKKYYHCFGCGAHGDVVGFMMQSEQLTFIDAVQELEHEFCSSNSNIVPLSMPFRATDELRHDFIERQIVKCEMRIAEGDYDGAITTARSLVEAILLELEQRLGISVGPYDGNLVRLYRRIRKVQNWDPGDEGVASTLKQILVGLASVVVGLGSLRNKMSDSHVPLYRAKEHHARLAVNSARTLCSFLISSHLYQETKRQTRSA